MILLSIILFVLATCIVSVVILQTFFGNPKETLKIAFYAVLLELALVSIFFIGLYFETKGG